MIELVVDYNCFDFRINERSEDNVEWYTMVYAFDVLVCDFSCTVPRVSFPACVS